eukprot:786245_1
MMSNSLPARFELNESKTITTFGSVFLFMNNTIGPGLMILPALYQHSGWLPSLIGSVLLCIMSYFIGVLLTKSIRAIPHNKYDDLKVEYLDLIKYYIGYNQTYSRRFIMQLCQVMYISFLIAMLIGGLIQTTQTVDLAIAKVCGNSYGFIYFPVHSIGFTKGHCTDSISPFNNADTYVLSIGTVIIYILIIPFCLKDLQEAIWIQYVATYGCIILIVLWCFMLTFSAEWDLQNVPLATPFV